jgi:hypothetical protein
MGSDYNKDTTIAGFSKLPGIADLPKAVMVKFIKSLKAEEEGNHEEANNLLISACEVEASIKAGNSI